MVFGSVDEWFKSTVLKTVDSKGSVSSNLTTSARETLLELRKDPAFAGSFLLPKQGSNYYYILI